MSIRVPIVDGLWSAAATWGQLSNTPTLHATTNISCTLATNFYSAVFTAPSVADASVGVWIFNVTGSTTATVTIALQEYNGAVWADAVSVARVSNAAFKANHWYYYEFATPYTYTTTTAGYYRIRLQSSVTQNMAANSAGTAFAFLAVDNRTGVPAATDDLFIGGGTSLRTVTMDGTQSIGSGTLTGLPTSYRSLGFGMLIAEHGLVNFDPTANTQLTCKGTIALQGSNSNSLAPSGDIQLGTVATPIPSGITCALLFNENSVNGNYGFYSLEAATGLGLKFKGQGRSLTFYKTTLVSGVGTTASPMVTTDAVDWSVNDEVWIATTSGYAEGERKYILVKNSATSYTLSDTAGGVEAGFANAHAAGAHILNAERNVKVASTSASYAWFGTIGSNVSGYLNFQWIKFEYYGGTTNGFDLHNNNTTGTMTLNNNVFIPTAIAANAVCNMRSSNTMETYTGNLFLGNNTTAGGATGTFKIGSVKNKTFTDFFILNAANAGLEIAGSINCTFNTVRILGSVALNNTASGGILMGNMFNSIFNNCESQASRRAGIIYNTGNSVNIKWNNCLFGSVGTNGTGDVVYLTTVPDYFITNYFNFCTFGSATLVSGYTSMAIGSGIFFSQLNSAAQRYEAYFATGSWQSTGAGLSDTTVRTASSLAIRLSPEDAVNGIIYEFYVLARAGKAVNVLGYLKKNATFGTDVLRVDFYLPGSITPDATQTMANDTEWNLFSLAGNYTGTIDTFAKVRIIAISSTAGAYVYLDDIFNGTNKITAVDTWLDGEPSKIMYEQVGDAAAVWAVPTSGNQTAATFGEKVAAKLATKIDLQL